MASLVIEMPPGALGVPVEAGGGRVATIDEPALVTWIERGSRFAWERGAECPCAPRNDQTQLNDVLCGFCQGGGRMYFGDAGYVVDADAFGDLDPLQLAIMARGGMGIRGIIQKVGGEQALYDRNGNWIREMSLVTVRAENKLGVMDRLIDLDQTISWSEVVVVGGGLAQPLKGRCVQPNLVRSISPVRDYVRGTDYELVDGLFFWKVGKKPAVGVRVSIHMLVHQSWLVVSHPHVLRTSTVDGASSVDGPMTPVGRLVGLPIQAVLKNEFVTSDRSGYPGGSPV